MITAILVTGFLYVAVFERDALLAFALGDAQAESSETDTNATPTDTDETAAVAAISAKIGVVVVSSSVQTIDSDLNVKLPGGEANIGCWGFG